MISVSAVSIDFKKAYDAIRRTQVRLILNKFQINSRLAHILNEPRYKVRVDKLSTTLFNIVMESIIRKSNNNNGKKSSRKGNTKIEKRSKDGLRK